MLHFLSPPQESRVNTAAVAHPRAVRTSPRHALPWPFRVSVEDVPAAFVELAVAQHGASASDCAFVS